MIRYLLTFMLAVNLISLAPVAHGAQAPVQLPDGEGKPLVQGMCTACHDLNQLTRSSGYTREEWKELVGTMINLSGTPQLDSITKYLETHFPPSAKFAPTLVSGPVSITFREWKVAQLG